MFASPEMLRFKCILKMRKDGGYNYYYNKGPFVVSEKEVLVGHGFKSWHHLHEAGENTLGGYLACEMRPPASLFVSDNGGALFSSVRYDAPFDQWVLTLGYQPGECPVPDWVCIRAAREECLKLMPSWAENHMIRDRVGSCKKGMCMVALGSSKITQTGGTLWAYGCSEVVQNPGDCGTYLHENATGFLRGGAVACEDSTVELSATGYVKAFDSATVVLRVEPDGSKGSVVAYGPKVRVFRTRAGLSTHSEQREQAKNLVPVSFMPLEAVVYQATANVNMPFGCAVD